MASKSQSNNKQNNNVFYEPEEPWTEGGSTVTAFFRNLGILKDDDDNKSDKDTE